MWSNGEIGSHAVPSVDDSDSIQKAWGQLATALLGLVALALVLPSPVSVVSVLTGTSERPDLPTAAVAASLLVVASLLVWGLLVWGLLVGAVAAVGHLPGRLGRQARLLLSRFAPGAARRLVLSAVGVSIIAGLGLSATGTASAGPSRAMPAAPSVAAPTTSWTSVEGSAVQLGSSPAAGPAIADPVNLDRPQSTAIDPIDIDWPAGPGQAAGSSSTSTHTVDIDWPGSTEPVVVLRGDSLWSIAARHLPPGASPAQIEQSWHRWYATNKTVIGNDPDLIQPGQILLPPTTSNGK